MLINTNAPMKELVPVTPRGEATRKKLLASAEIEFGSKGFPAASVSSVTQRADVGQGTFYLYFHSKEEIFSTLVREIGAEQCQRIATLSAGLGLGSSKEIERKLVTMLVEFVAEQPGRQRILSEAQFVDAPVFREVQEAYVAAVAAVLSATETSTRKEDLSLRAAAMLGAAERAALQHCHWAAKPVGKALIDAVLLAA
jgi:AcrR family transcriptional regulator